MRILIIHNRYGKFSGEESVLESEKLLLEKNGNDIQLYTRSSSEISGVWSKVNAFFSGFYNYKSILDIKKILLEFKPEIVHVHNLYPLISPSILNVISKYKIPIVMTVHNYRLICPNGLLFTNGKICVRCENGKEWNCVLKNCEGSIAKSTGYALRNIYSRKREFYSSNISKFICLTKFQKQKLINNGFQKEKLKVLPNYLDSKINTDTPKVSNSYIAFSGRINRQKGFDLIIQAMNLIKLESNFSDNLSLLAAGQIDMTFINQYKVPQNIELLGALSKDKMEDFYLNAQFIIFASQSYEGAPIVFLEAMKYELPIIAPRLGAYPEIIEDGFNGLLFNPGDYTDLSKKIKTLSSDKRLCKQLGERGNQKLKEKYSPDIHYTHLMSIYRELNQ
tara:strand:- start:1104 stop:2279 length:1176 start_codon:yes stop_codon:yes gene_type:complete